MLSISPKLAARLPIRIDISWMKARAAIETAPVVPTPAENPELGHVLAQILELNPSASVEFLAQFPPNALRDYLEHLVSASMPRGRLARRIRPDRPAVEARAARA